MTKYSAMLQINLVPHPSRSALQTAYIPSPGSGRKSQKKVNKGVRWKAFLLCNYPDSQPTLPEKQEGRAILEMSLGHARKKLLMDQYYCRYSP